MFGKKKSDDAAYKAAVRALAAHGRREDAAGIREETDAYLTLNTCVNEAARRLPWHRR